MVLLTGLIYVDLMKIIMIKIIQKTSYLSYFRFYLQMDKNIKLSYHIDEHFLEEDNLINEGKRNKKEEVHFKCIDISNGS